MIPYFQNAGHNLKKVAARHFVPVTFSASMKLLFVLVTHTGKCAGMRIPTNNKQGCIMVHVLPFTRHVSRIIYEIPFSYRKVYVGQTSRCLNVRMREHHSFSQSHPNRTWPYMRGIAAATPFFSSARVFDVLHDKTGHRDIFHHLQEPTILLQFTFAHSPKYT